MSTASFQFRDPLNRNPYVADQHNPVIYPWAKWGEYATSPYLYVYGRAIPFRSYYGEDLNLSARPITRVIEPTVLQYGQAPTPCSGAAASEDTMPVVQQCPLVLNNRFASLGAQVDESTRNRNLLLALLIIVAAAAIAWCLLRKK